MVMTLSTSEGQSKKYGSNRVHSINNVFPAHARIIHAVAEETGGNALTGCRVWVEIAGDLLSNKMIEPQVLI